MAECSKCKGACCKYVTVQIDEPEEDIDFEEIKWFLAHENVTVYIDHDDDWCVEFKTPCKNLNDKYQCDIYKGRPKVCAEHELEECEGNMGHEEYHKRLFSTFEDVEAYRKEVGK